MNWKAELEKLDLDLIRDSLKRGKYIVFQVKTGYSAGGMRKALCILFPGYPIYKHKSKFIVGRRGNVRKAPIEFND